MMDLLINVATILIQIITAFIFPVCIYLVFALLNYQGGFDAFIGFTLIQPLFAILFAGLTIVACAFIGLPIRLILKLRSWWTKRWYIALIGLFFGVGLVLLALVPGYLIPTHVNTLNLHPPNSYVFFCFAITGWFLTAFSALHLNPPASATILMKIWLSKIYTKISNGL